jgi:hypothetical protein
MGLIKSCPLLYSAICSFYSLYVLIPPRTNLPPLSHTRESEGRLGCTYSGSRSCLLSLRYATEVTNNKQQTTARWPESAIELYWSSHRRLSAKLMPTFADRGCRVVSTMDPHGRILGFIDRSRYFYFQVVSQLYSRDWANPIPDPLLLRKSGSAGNRTWNL